jgi:hypothetical protein
LPDVGKPISAAALSDPRCHRNAEAISFDVGSSGKNWREHPRQGIGRGLSVGLQEIFKCPVLLMRAGAILFTRVT